MSQSSSSTRLVAEDMEEPSSADIPVTSDRPRPYSVYVLLVFLVTYLLNQLDRYMLGIVTKPMAQDIHYGDQACMANHSITAANLCNETSKTRCEIDGTCKWDYNGQGMEYEILAGPIFIVIYTFVGIPLGFFADVYNRKNLLAACLALWSTMTLLTGFVHAYWQLAVTRFVLGIGQAGCTPFATSLIADYFSKGHRAAALGFYNWGIYIGYSMSYALGNYVTLSMGWRWAWIISGIPGLVVSVIILLTVREPDRGQNDVGVGNSDLLASQSGEVTVRQKTAIICSRFAKPSLLVLCLAGSVRNGAGYVWAYNTQIYYTDLGESPGTIGKFMSWIPLVFGCIGVLLGGFISDRVVKRVGVYARVLVLVLSQLLAAPFVAGALYLSPPYAYYSLIPGYIVGEMWVGITLAVVVELVPPPQRTAAVAVYMFIISNIGGNMILLVPPLKAAFQNIGFDVVTSLRASLYIMYPGMYVLGAVLFLLTVAILRWDLKRLQQTEYEHLQ